MTLTGHDLPNVIHRPGMRKVCEMTPYLDDLWLRMQRALWRGRMGTAARLQRMMVRHGRAQMRSLGY